MIHGRVIGELWSTVRLDGLAGHKLLIVRPEGARAREDVVAIDLVGAGRGERVVVALGRAARNALGDSDAAIEAALIAIVDDLDLEVGASGAETLAPPPTAPEDEDLAPPKKKTAVKKSAGKKAPVRKKAKKKASAKRGRAAARKPEDETADLFPAPEEDEIEGPVIEEAAEEPIDYVVERDEDDLPGFDDVDAIWGDDDEKSRS